jgi:hypothetical protein
MADNTETRWADYESGPFCQHWGDPDMCEEMCVCGHPCHRHSYGDGCEEPGCTCEKFKDIE